MSRRTVYAANRPLYMVKSQFTSRAHPTNVAQRGIHRLTWFLFLFLQPKPRENLSFSIVLRSYWTASVDRNKHSAKFPINIKIVAELQMRSLEMAKESIRIDNCALNSRRLLHVEFLRPRIANAENRESLLHVERMHQPAPHEFIERLRIIVSREILLDKSYVFRLVADATRSKQCIAGESVDRAAQQNGGTDALALFQTCTDVLVDVYGEVLSEPTYACVAHRMFKRIILSQPNPPRPFEVGQLRFQTRRLSLPAQRVKRASKPPLRKRRLCLRHAPE